MSSWLILPNVRLNLCDLPNHIAPRPAVRKSLSCTVINIFPSCMCYPWMYNKTVVYTAKPAQIKLVLVSSISTSYLMRACASDVTALFTHGFVLASNVTSNTGKLAFLIPVPIHTGLHV